MKLNEIAPRLLISESIPTRALEQGDKFQDGEGNSIEIKKIPIMLGSTKKRTNVSVNYNYETVDGKSGKETVVLNNFLDNIGLK